MTPPEPLFIAAVILLPALGALSGLAFGPSAARRALAWCFLLPCACAPFLLPEGAALERFALAIMVGMGFFKMLDLSRERRPLSPLQRALFMAFPFDTLSVTRVRPRLQPGLVAAAIGWAALASGALWLHQTHLPAGGAARWVTRWGLGLVGFCSTVEAMNAVITQGALLVGFALPPLHRLPMLSRTVQEFWGERWNLSVQRLLQRNVFWPLARRRRVRAGVVATFVASALLHVWIMAVALDWAMAGLWAIFFLLQGVFLLVERRLRLASRPGPLPRVWTIVALVGSSPLFIEPALRVFPG